MPNFANQMPEKSCPKKPDFNIFPRSVTSDPLKILVVKNLSDGTFYMYVNHEMEELSLSMRKVKILEKHLKKGIIIII